MFLELGSIRPLLLFQQPDLGRSLFEFYKAQNLEVVSRRLLIDCFVKAIRVDSGEVYRDWSLKELPGFGTEGRQKNI